jgi:hypothetical protein
VTPGPRGVGQKKNADFDPHHGEQGGSSWNNPTIKYFHADTYFDTPLKSIEICEKIEVM